MSVEAHCPHTSPTKTEEAFVFNLFILTLRNQKYDKYVYLTHLLAWCAEVWKQRLSHLFPFFAKTLPCILLCVRAKQTESLLKKKILENKSDTDTMMHLRVFCSFIKFWNKLTWIHTPSFLFSFHCFLSPIYFTNLGVSLLCLLFVMSLCFFWLIDTYWVKKWSSWTNVLMKKWLLQSVWQSAIVTWGFTTG